MLGMDREKYIGAVDGLGTYCQYKNREWIGKSTEMDRVLGAYFKYRNQSGTCFKYKNGSAIVYLFRVQKRIGILFRIQKRTGRTGNLYQVQK